MCHFFLNIFCVKKKYYFYLFFLSYIAPFFPPFFPCLTNFFSLARFLFLIKSIISFLFEIDRFFFYKKKIFFQKLLSSLSRKTFFSKKTSSVYLNFLIMPAQLSTFFYVSNYQEKISSGFVIGNATGY